MDCVLHLFYLFVYLAGNRSLFKFVDSLSEVIPLLLRDSLEIIFVTLIGDRSPFSFVSVFY